MNTTQVKDTDVSRRGFMAGMSALGLGATLLPGVLWSQMAAASTSEVTVAMIKDAATLSGLTFSDEEAEKIREGVTGNLNRIVALHEMKIPNSVAPPFYFSPLTPGMHVDKTAHPFKASKPRGVKRPAKLEDAAFWSVADLGELLRTRAVTSTELTQMYLARLHKHNEKLNCVVTFLDDVALAQAKKADAEIAAGNYKGPLHGIPWGAKDIMTFAGYKTTWGSGAYKEQMLDETATVIELLTAAGAVLLAKLTTGELAGGDQWFGGRTNNPWNLEQGSSGSSAGSASATAAGCVAFALGTETGGSILSPSGRCGATGLRPTFGRVSRYGVMALSWTQDRIGPICRAVEDCALVMSVIAKQDGRDLSVADIPFNWDASLDPHSLKVGYLEDAFADADRDAEWAASDKQTLAKLKEMGFALVPLKVPKFPTDVLRLSVESAVFHDELLRTGLYKEMTNKDRGERMRTARLIPAVEYLQSQRMRAMMMQELAKATASVDVYVTPSTHGSPRREGDRDASNAPEESATQRHSNMANLACYPAVALPTGFVANGAPTSVSFMAQPYREAALLAVAKAFQDATNFNKQQPPLFAAS